MAVVIVVSALLAYSRGFVREVLAIGGWTLLNVVVAWAAMGEYSIAWQAHLGGFFTGLLTFGLFDPKPPVQHDSEPAE